MVQVSGVGAPSKTAQVGTTQQSTTNDKPQAEFEKDLSHMAKKFNMSEEEFKKMNPGITNWNSVKAGKPVNVPLAKLETTVYQLALKYNMDYKDLLDLNPQITDPTRLKAGTWIMVPLRPFNDKPQAEFEKSAWNMARKFNMTVEEFQKMNPQIKNWNSVKAGEPVNVPLEKLETKFDQLAKKYNMEDKDLLALNPQITDPTKLKAGTWIMVPLRPFGEDKETTPKTDPTPTPKPAPKPNTVPEPKGEEAKGNVKVTLNNGKTFKLSDLRDDAIRSGQKEFNRKYGLNNPYLVRPMPHVVNGKIEATCDVQAPTTNKGPLKGKVVILNSGHGGYAQENGFFDAGTIHAVKNAQGKYMPIEEWRVARDYTDALSAKLRAQGAHVVIIQGAVQNGGMYSQKYIQNLLAGKVGSKEAKTLMKNTSKSNMLFMSIHVESMKENSSNKGCSVKYRSGDTKDKQLADKIQSQVNSGFTLLAPKVQSQELYVLNAIGDAVPGVLLEIGNIANNNIQNALLSNYDQNKYMDCVAKAIVETMK